MLLAVMGHIINHHGSPMSKSARIARPFSRQQFMQPERREACDSVCLQSVRTCCDALHRSILDVNVASV